MTHQESSARGQCHYFCVCGVGEGKEGQAGHYPYTHAMQCQAFRGKRSRAYRLPSFSICRSVAAGTSCSRRHYKNPKHERRVKSAWSVAADCDLLLFIVDAHRQVRHLCNCMYSMHNSVVVDRWRVPSLLQVRQGSKHTLLQELCSCACSYAGTQVKQTVYSNCELTPCLPGSCLAPFLDACLQLAQPDPRVERLVADFGSGANLGLGSVWEPPQAVLVMNKVDAVRKEDRTKLLPMADRLRGLAAERFQDVFWVSALRGEGQGTAPALLAIP